MPSRLPFGHRLRFPSSPRAGENPAVLSPEFRSWWHMRAVRQLRLVSSAPPPRRPRSRSPRRDPAARQRGQRGRCPRTPARTRRARGSRRTPAAPTGRRVAGLDDTAQADQAERGELNAMPSLGRAAQLGKAIRPGRGRDRDPRASVDRALLGRLQMTAAPVSSARARSPASRRRLAAAGRRRRAGGGWRPAGSRRAPRHAPASARRPGRPRRASCRRSRHR